MLAVNELYKYVKELVTSIQEIQSFDWWNENIINEINEKPGPIPAVFFELNGIIWLPSTDGSISNKSDLIPEQVGNAEFTLHIVTNKKDSKGLDESELRHLAIIELVFRKVHFAPTKQFLEGVIQRLRDDPVPVHTVLRDWPLVFSARLFESPTTNIGDTIDEVIPWTQEIVGESVIKPHTQGPTGITFEIQ